MRAGACRRSMCQQHPTATGQCSLSPATRAHARHAALRSTRTSMARQMRSAPKRVETVAQQLAGFRPPRCRSRRASTPGAAASSTGRERTQPAAQLDATALLRWPVPGSASRLPGVPSRAPSRSTRCSQRAPASAIACEQFARVDFVARLGVELALAAGARSGRRADRWRESEHRTPSEPRKLASRRAPARRRTLRMELHAAEIAWRTTAAGTAAIVELPPASSRR